MHMQSQKFSFEHSSNILVFYMSNVMFEGHETSSHLLSVSLPTRLVTGPFSTSNSDKKKKEETIYWNRIV